MEQLDLLPALPKTRAAQRGGIHVHGLRYIALALAAYVGESVTIRYDPRDLAEARVYRQDRLLCRAICSDLAGTTSSHHAVNQRSRENGV